MTISDRIAQAAKRWAEAVALIYPAKVRWWDAVAAAQVEIPIDDAEEFGCARYERMFHRERKYVRLGVFGDGQDGIDHWTYTSHMGELAGQDASDDPLCIELRQSYAAKVDAMRRAGSARGALLRMTRAAIKRGEL